MRQASDAGGRGSRDETSVGDGSAQDDGATETPVDSENPRSDETTPDTMAMEEAAASVIATPATPAVPTAPIASDLASGGDLDALAAVSAGDDAAAMNIGSANIGSANIGSANTGAAAGADDGALMARGAAASEAQRPGADAQVDATTTANQGAADATESAMNASVREQGRSTADSRQETGSASSSASSSTGAAMEPRAGMGGDGAGNQGSNQGSNQGGNQGGNQGSGSQDQRGSASDPAADARVRAATRAEQALAAAAQFTEQPGSAAGAGAASAVAGRLSEVEASVARDRVVDSLERGLLSIESSSGGTESTATTASTPMQPAMVLPASSDGSAISAAMGEPAADLARPSLDPAPTGRLAAKGIDILSNQRGGAITMRLEPPALGQLRIELQISQGAVVADFTAATPEARVLLEANLGMLRERLESQGLAVERMTVHGGRGTEAAPVGAAAHGGELRQDQNGSGSDARDRGDRGGGRQDAAGGESRGRRDGEPGRERNPRDGRGEDAGFLGMFEAQRAQDGARRMSKAV